MPSEPIIPTVEVYKTIRNEVIEQKKCQFQILTTAIAVTSAAWAYALGPSGNSIACLAPIPLCVCALILILDKAISIQRMVGYLQCLETNDPPRQMWSWERDLDDFRGEDRGQASGGARDKRKHSYVAVVSILLLTLSALCIALYLAIGDNKHGPAPLFVSIIIIAGTIWYTLRQYGSLTTGKNSSTSIKDQWKKLLKKPLGPVAEN